MHPAIVSYATLLTIKVYPLKRGLSIYKIITLIHNIVMPTPVPGQFEPLQWAVLDDACWLVFRLFGVNIRPRFRGIRPADHPWEGYFPWICQELHQPASYAGEQPDRQPRVCALDNPGGKPLPRRGRCISGLAFRTLKLPPGSGLKGSLILGPFLESPPTERDLRGFQSRTGVAINDTIRWAYMQSPVLPPRMEKELVGFCLRLFSDVGGKLAGLRAKSARVQAGEIFESMFPPLRLADDFPLHIFGVFLTYWKLPPEGTGGKPSKACDLEYIDKGKCRIETEGSSFTLERGQAVLVLPGQSVRMSPVPADSPCETISITFNANASLLSAMSGRPLLLDPFQQTMLTRLCTIGVPRDDRSHCDSGVKMLLALILLAFRETESPAVQQTASAPPAGRRSRQTATINNLKAYIDSEPGRPISLLELARITKTSVPTVLRMFKRETGTTPGRYHLQARIRQAEQLLRQSMLTVGQIGDQLGFSSAFHFSSTFKKETGVSPSEFAHSTRSAQQQVERAKALLTEKKMPVADTAYFLGFPTVEDFQKTFRHYAGVTPEEFARGKTGTENQ